MILLNQQLAEMQNYAAVAAAAGTDPEAPMDDAVKLVQLQKQLEDLQRQYTARHPDVVRLKEKINDIKATLTTQTEQRGPDKKPNSGGITGTPPIMSQSSAILLSQQREARVKSLLSKRKFQGSRNRLNTMCDWSTKPPSASRSC